MKTNWLTTIAILILAGAVYYLNSTDRATLDTIRDLHPEVFEVKTKAVKHKPADYSGLDAEAIARVRARMDKINPTYPDWEEYRDACIQRERDFDLKAIADKGSWPEVLFAPEEVHDWETVKNSAVLFFAQSPDSPCEIYGVGPIYDGLMIMTTSRDIADVAETLPDAVLVTDLDGRRILLPRGQIDGHGCGTSNYGLYVGSLMRWFPDGLIRISEDDWPAVEAQLEDSAAFDDVLYSMIYDGGKPPPLLQPDSPPVAEDEEENEMDTEKPLTWASGSVSIGSQVGKGPSHYEIEYRDGKHVIIISEYEGAFTSVVMPLDKWVKLRAKELEDTGQ